MVMYKTAEEALQALSANISDLNWKNNPADREKIKSAILDVVSKTSVSADGKLTVFYLGYIGGKDSFDIAKDMVNDSGIRLLNKTEAFNLMNYPAASCGVSKVATSTYNPICYTALFSLRFYRLFYNFFPVPVLSHIYL